MTQCVTANQTWPTNEEALFRGRATALVRELFAGSSRADVLAAIRRAPLEAWELSDDKTQVGLHAGSTNVCVTSGSAARAVWIESDTPHGKFSLPGSHSVSQQILRRLERRFEGYKLALRADARTALGELSERVLAGKSHEWVQGASDGFWLQEIAGSRRGYYYKAAGGFVISVDREIFEGEVTNEESQIDLVRFNAQLRYQLEQSNRRGTYTGLGYVPNHHSFAPPRPPMPPGRFRNEWIEVKVHHEHLSAVAKALGLSAKTIIKTETSAGKDRRNDALWKQARGS